MRPHISHLRFYVGVLKKPFKAYWEDRRLKSQTRRKTRYFQIYPRPTEPQNRLRRAEKQSPDPKEIKWEGEEAEIT